MTETSTKRRWSSDRLHRQRIQELAPNQARLHPLPTSSEQTMRSLGRDQSSVDKRRLDFGRGFVGLATLRREQ
jgi:hypothetical protein